ncbi:hypothetical protein ABIA39_000267 [Nocardia sp. GAS34]|uniref:hypothetical protein n=1 Tax=unclassified Nocardia TaxID=2637762 RepID=UPI003D258BA9
MPNSPTPTVWTPTPLGMIRDRFTRLAAYRVPGLPPGWDQLGAGVLAPRLMDPGVPISELDAVWAQLIGHARTGEESAVLVCAGAALPMLSSISKMLCGHPVYRADTESMTILGFLEALEAVDIERPYVAYRLRWATFHRTCIPIRERRAAPSPADWFGEHEPTPASGVIISSPHGHPDLLLAMAVEEGVLSAAEAGLITDTRLEHHKLVQLAPETGVPYQTLAKRRRRAEQRLAVWLRERMAEQPRLTAVERAVLDGLAPSGDRHRSAALVSRNRPGAGVLSVPKSASRADVPSHEQARRCA